MDDKGILFSTGFTAMAMEVVWTRAFTPVLKTQVYSFALIVFTYLGATFFGSLDGIAGIFGSITSVPPGKLISASGGHGFPARAGQ